MPKYTFLTGATGFVGAAVARFLISKGHRLLVLSRPNSDQRNLRGLDVEFVVGDVTRPETYIDALMMCSGLFHVAGDYRLWVPDAEAMRRVNILGTHELMLAALSAGIERIVYTSSVATLGVNTGDTPVTERKPLIFGEMLGVYKQSKFLAEKEVSRLIQYENLPAVIVNPTCPLGPGDIKPTPTGRIILEAVKGRIPAYVNTGLNIVHVEDVAAGHWLAFEYGKIGERYILGGENLALSEILAIVEKICGTPAPRIKLSCEAIYPVALCMEIAAHLTGGEPQITLAALRMARHKLYFSSFKAEQELGYKPRPAKLAIADAIAWFQSENYL